MPHRPWISQDDDVRRIRAAADTLEPRACRLLCFIAERLVDGAHAYRHAGGGDFAPDRDYARDELEELIDARIYQLAARLDDAPEKA